MNILVVTAIYPAEFRPTGATPLVHYFTKEWVKQGHKVKVLDFSTNYPMPLVWGGKLFNKFLTSKLGMVIPQNSAWDYDEIVDDVNISHCHLNKIIPHGRFGKKAIKNALEFTKRQIDKSRPDVIIGHWANPTLEIVSKIGTMTGIPTCVVFHETAKQIMHYYGAETQKMIDNLSCVGFRSKPLKEDFESTFGKHPSFMAYSGVPEKFLNEATCVPNKSFETIDNYIFVGALMERKHPAALLPAIQKVYNGKTGFKITFIGAGKEESRIKELGTQLHIEDNIILTGRIPRDEIMEHLKSSEVFIMISEAEVFGLVYLEAMAFGCIPIASRNEGFDGIIIDGKNGFLCEAGNVSELAAIVSKLKAMSKDDVNRISNNARKTAMQFSDSIVASNYLNNIELTIKMI